MIEISQGGDTDKMVDVPVGNILQPQKKAHDEAVEETMDEMEITQEQARGCVRTNLAGTGLEQCQGRSQFNEQTAEGREGRFSRLSQSVVFETDRTSRAL